jgi:hypothetical protein
MNDQEGIEELSVMDITEPMSTGRRKRIKRARRTVIGYDSAEPEMCCNCLHFKNALYATGTSEYFPPRCEKHLIEIERHAICDTWITPTH